jgi:uncharacterized protein YbjT (DUF2867 family)
MPLLPPITSAPCPTNEVTAPSWQSAWPGGAGWCWIAGTAPHVLGEEVVVGPMSERGAGGGTVVVTGATGTIGRELVPVLVARGVPVRAVVRYVAAARDLLPAATELVAADFRDPDALDRALRGGSRLFLVSNDPALEPAVVDAAARTGASHVVKSSAIGFGDAPPPGHAAVEEHLARSGLSHTVLRSNAFMQTLAGYLPRLVEPDGTFELPAGEGRTAFVDAADIAAVAAEVLLHPPPTGTVHLVTGPEALTMADVAATLAARLARPVAYRPVGVDRARARLPHRVGPMAGFLVEH